MGGGRVSYHSGNYHNNNNDDDDRKIRPVIGWMEGEKDIFFFFLI